MILSRIELRIFLPELKLYSSVKHFFHRKVFFKSVCLQLRNIKFVNIIAYAVSLVSNGEK